MLALACLMLFALAAIAAVGAMSAAIKASRLDIALLNKRYGHPPRELAISWRIVGARHDVRATNLVERPQTWVPLPERLAA